LGKWIVAWLEDRCEVVPSHHPVQEAENVS
jgi:hypothetical protein